AAKPPNAMPIKSRLLSSTAILFSFLDQINLHVKQSFYAMLTLNFLVASAPTVLLVGKVGFERNLCEC
ncbi:hypothetical protein, partial [Sulfurospirillum sp. hDNRA2]|uniref:hypothetical protein n=1 Tax=Sulfurospirillum sp. hDNRA2 TaxID=3237298 RepID=UPI0020B82EA3